MLIHAFKRTKTHVIDFAGKKTTFIPNEVGHVVADVPSGPLLNRLIAIPTGYRPYDLTPAQLIEQEQQRQAETLEAITQQEAEALQLRTEQARKPIDESEDTGSSPYILTDEESGTRIDLREMDLDTLRLFAKENEVPFHPNHKAETLRDKIVEQLNNVGAPAAAEG